MKRGDVKPRVARVPLIAIWLKRCLLVDAEGVEIVPPREMKNRDTLSDDDDEAAA